MYSEVKVVIKTIKHIKFILYMLCFTSLVLPMNYNGHTGQWVFGINYFTNLFSMGYAKEELYWFLYYVGLFILPVAVQIVFWKKSSKGIVSDIIDILIGTACATIMFCFFISFKNSPAGIMTVIVLQVLIVAMGCLGLVSKMFLKQSFEELMLIEKNEKKQK